jgi:hypothetical protein
MGVHHFLVPPPHAYQAQMALPSPNGEQQTVDFKLGHAFPDQSANLLIHLIDDGGRPSNLVTWSTS